MRDGFVLWVDLTVSNLFHNKNCLVTRDLSVNTSKPCNNSQGFQMCKN